LIGLIIDVFFLFLCPKGVIEVLMMILWRMSSVFGAQSWRLRHMSWKRLVKWKSSAKHELLLIKLTVQSSCRLSAPTIWKLIRLYICSGLLVFLFESTGFLFKCSHMPFHTVSIAVQSSFS